MVRNIFFIFLGGTFSTVLSVNTGRAVSAQQVLVLYLPGTNEHFSSCDYCVPVDQKPITYRDQVSLAPLATPSVEARQPFAANPWSGRSLRSAQEPCMLGKASCRVRSSGIIAGSPD